MNLQLLRLSMLATLVAAALAVPVVAQGDGAVLGRHGQTFELLSGEPAGSELDAPGSELTLVITDSSGAEHRLTVPTTEGAGIERSPRLVYFDATDTAFVLWERQIEDIHSWLSLIAYRPADGWSEPIILAGSPFTLQLEPQLTVTRDHVDTLDGASGSLERTIVHLLWREEGQRVLYAPVLVFEGSFELVTTHLFRLDTLFGEDETGLSSVASLLELQPGSDGRSVTVGFTRPANQQIEAIQVRVLPGGLADLAEAAYETVAESFGLDLQSAAANARAHIVFTGHRLNRELVGVVAAAAESYIKNANGSFAEGGWIRVADDARAHIVFTGAKIDREGLGSPAVGGRGLDPLTRFARIVTTGLDGTERAHYLELRRTASLPLPVDLSEPTVALFSQDGTAALLARTELDQVVYRESLEDGSWSEPTALSFGQQRTEADVYRLLEERVRAQR